MREVLDSMLSKINESKIIEKLGLQVKKYFLVSIHREENVDNPDSLKSIIKYLLELKIRYKVPIIISTHPRTRKKLKEIGYEDKNPLIRFSKPYGFHEYNNLQMNAFCLQSVLFAS